MMTSLHTYLAPINTAHARMIDTTLAWSAINSGTGNLSGIARMADAVDAAFTPLGYSVTRHDTRPVVQIDDDGTEQAVTRGPVLHFNVRPDAPRRVLLTGHLDTVFPKDSPFQIPVKRTDGTLHGPGVADMKGGIVVMLEALRAFEASPFSQHVGIDVMLNADEECGSHASAHRLTQAARHADIGLVFEPALADGTLAGARAGSGNYTLIINGISAHAGRAFQDGRNALVAAAGLITNLNALNGQREGVTVNMAMLHGGQALNVVPGRAVLRLNARARSAADLEWVDKHIRTIVAGDAGPGIDVTLHGGMHRPCKTLDGPTEALFHLVREAGQALDLDITWTPTGGCCDGNNLAAAGLPTVDTLGVRGGLIHSDQEFAVIDSFVERAQLTTLLLLRLASGEAPWPKEAE